MENVNEHSVSFVRAAPMITSQTVRKLWSYLQSQYSTTVTHKQDAPEMSLISWITPNFLTRYTTTIGRTIYTPFEIGVPSDGWSLESQVAVAAHEHQHIVQANRDGALYYFSYLFNSAARARYESEAYQSTLEVKWFLGQEIYPDNVADGLANYGCSAADVTQARNTLERYADAIRRGDVMTEAGQETIFFLCR